MLTKLQAEFPGVEFNFSQYLQDNVAEAVSGVKGENSIKLFGNDLQVISDTAAKIKSVLASVHGIADLAVFNSLGQPTVQIDIDRKRASRYGLSPGDINATIKWRSAGTRLATCMSREATGIFRLSCASRRSSGKVLRIFEISRSRCRFAAARAISASAGVGRLAPAQRRVDWCKFP